VDAGEHQSAADSAPRKTTPPPTTPR
jgi:hypothetical protein